MSATTEVDYRAARDEISVRNERIICAFNHFIDSKFGPGDVREGFLIDGSPIISRDEFSHLPSPLQQFFAQGRMALPPAHHTFVREENGSPAVHTKSLVTMVALRGFRFYGADGKYTWGPNEKEALYLLTENLRNDRQLLPHLKVMEPASREQWLGKLAAWDYLRNDMSATYYLKACQAAIDPDPQHDEQQLQCIDHALDVITTGYIHTLLLLPPIDVDEHIFTDAQAVAQNSYPFVSAHTSHDVVRFHRELGNPQAVMFAFYLMYETNTIHEADLVAAPLYGAIDIGHSLRYLMTYGDMAYEHITGTPPPHAASVKEVLFFHHKVIPRGKPRSEMTGFLPSNPKGMSLLDKMPASVQQKFTSAFNILFVDDSAGTFGSRDEIIHWMHDHIGPSKQYDWVVAHGGIRWAEAQHASLQNLVDAQAIASTPLSKHFKDPIYGGGRSGYIPDAHITDSMLHTERSAFTLSDLQTILEKLSHHGILHGVGYDLYETLVCRTVSRQKRRQCLNDQAASLFTQAGFPISAETYGDITRPVWLADIASMAQTNQEIDYFTTLKKMILQVMQTYYYTPTDSQIENLVTSIAHGEFTYESSVTVPVDGLPELLTATAKRKIPQGIYSNTPYPEYFMNTIIKNTGISRYINPKNILFSSTTGVVKPSKETMIMLADTLGINVDHMAFADNAKSGVEAAVRARAIPIRVLYKDEDLPLQKRIYDWQTFHRTIIQP